MDHKNGTGCTIGHGHFTGEPICVACGPECDCLICTVDALERREAERAGEHYSRLMSAVR